MSQHPSLKSKGKGKAHRSVWKRFERLKFLSEKDKWSEKDSVYGLEKMKLLKVKIKKEKAAEAAAEGAVAQEGAVLPQAGKSEASAKGAGAKPAQAVGKEDAKGSSKAEKSQKK